MKRILPRAAPLFTLVVLAGCAYFNALYNARRLYSDAEAARERGDDNAARLAHLESLEKAARSLERDPDGRWSDDALLLIGQNRFALGECSAARAALSRAIRETDDPDLAARARAWLGAAAQCLGDAALATDHLDRALARVEAGSATASFAHLWRARARFDLDQDEGAWTDLERAMVRDDLVARDAALEQIARALAADRRDLALPGFGRLLRDPRGDQHADSIGRLAQAAASRWGGAFAREALESAARAPWAGQQRDRLVIERARHAAAAGDTALAIEELEHAAARSAIGPANAARVTLARLRLTMIEDPAELDGVRRTLLPAIADQSVRPLIHGIGMVGALLDRARLGQPLALFAAAEIARDRLRAHALARRLFVGYADMAGPGPWSTKAVLAALALEPPAAEQAALRERFARATDVYALAARGSIPDGFEDAESRLDRVLSSLVVEAGRESERRDIAVGLAIAELDSITTTARADSLLLSCGSAADSLGLIGIRRDSVNAACLREDVALVDSFLRVDSAALRVSSDTIAAEPERLDTTRAARE